MCFFFFFFSVFEVLDLDFYKNTYFIKRHNSKILRLIINYKKNGPLSCSSILVGKDGIDHKQLCNNILSHSSFPSSLHPFPTLVCQLICNFPCHRVTLQKRIFAKFSKVAGWSYSNLLALDQDRCAFQAF